MHHQQHRPADIQLQVSSTSHESMLLCFDVSSLWNDLMWGQLHYIQANYENADVIFNNGNFGFMKALANIRT